MSRDIIDRAEQLEPGDYWFDKSERVQVAELAGRMTLVFSTGTECLIEDVKPTKAGWRITYRSEGDLKSGVLEVA